MNRAYRSVWNASSGTWVAVPETVQASGKGRGRAGIATVVRALAALGMGGVVSSAYAVTSATDMLPYVAGNSSADEGDVSGGGAMQGLMLASAAPLAGSGVNVGGLSSTYVTAAYYSQVAGLADGTGATPPSDKARALGLGAIAVGSNAAASGVASTAVGVQAWASANDAVALGSGSVANEADTVSVGNDGTGWFTAYDANGKPYTIQNQANTRRIVNMAAGQGDTDAVNVAQLKSAGFELDGAGTVLNGAVTYDPGTLASGAPTITLSPGTGDSAYFRDGNRAAGLLPVGTVLHNVANGIEDTDATNVGQVYDILNSAAPGTSGGVRVMQAVAPSSGSQPTGPNIDTSGLNITYNTAAYYSQVAGLGNGSGATPPSDMARAYGKGSVAIGSNTLTTGTAATAVGLQAYASANDAVALGSGSVADEANTVSVGSRGGSYLAYDASGNAYTISNAANTRRIVNLAAGQDDTDAANIGQLRSAGMQIDTAGNLTNALVAYDDTSRSTVTLGGANGTRITNLAAGSAASDAVNAGQLRAAVSMLGGGADLAADGSLVAPAYHMQGGTQNTVGAALDSLDTGLSSLQGQISDSGIGLVRQDPATRTISVGAGTDGGIVSFAGTAGARVLTGVAAGSVEAGSVEAVNGAQLHATASSVASALGGGAAVGQDGTLSAPSYTVGGTTVNSVGDALTNIDGRVTTNTKDIANLQTSVTNIEGSVANAVQYDSAAHDKVTLGGKDATGKVGLTNLADARLADTSTDAVTGAQLYATNLQVAGLGQAIQTVAEDTKYLAVDSSSGAASASGGSALAIGGGASASGAAATAIGDLASATANGSVALGANSVADRDNTVSVGSVGGERQITNVAAGTAPTDAVNLGQLNSALGGVKNRIDDIDRTARRGIAAASALNIVTPYLPGRTTVNAGVASYRGQAALGIGLSRWNDKGSINYNLGVSSAGGNSTIVRAGIGIVFGG